MAKHQYISTGVLFEGDESDSDEYRVNGFRSRIPRSLKKKNNGNVTEQENQKQLTVQRIQDIERSTLESAQRSVKILQETVDIGIQSAKELARQGETLQNTNVALDKIDCHLKKSQKDINGIKSVFYELKNRFTGKSRSPSPSTRHISPHKKSPKIRRSRFYGTEGHLTCGPSKFGNLEAPTTSLLSLDMQSSPGPRSQQLDDILEAHLEGITQTVSQLKVLGEEFGREIDHQDKLIDILEDKVIQTDTKIGKQRKEMAKLL